MMKKLFHYLSFLQIPSFAIALFYYLQPLWMPDHPLESVNKGLLFTGLALSFVSLVEMKKPLEARIRKMLLFLLLPPIVFMFSISAYWLIYYPEAMSFASSLMVLGIGMLSILKLLAVESTAESPAK